MRDRKISEGTLHQKWTEKHPENPQCEKYNKFWSSVPSSHHVHVNAYVNFTGCALKEPGINVTNPGQFPNPNSH